MVYGERVVVVVVVVSMSFLFRWCWGDGRQPDASHDRASMLSCIFSLSFILSKAHNLKGFSLCICSVFRSVFFEMTPK